MTTAGLQQESECFQTFLHGTGKAKIDALDWLENHHSWDAKRWIQGLLYDSAPEVRIRAAAYIADTHYLHLLPDIQAALHNEKDPQTRAELQKQVDKLKALLP